MSADILRDLARAKVAFQLRAIETIIRDPSPCHPGAITMSNTPSYRTFVGKHTLNWSSIEHDPTPPHGGQVWDSKRRAWVDARTGADAGGGTFLNRLSQKENYCEPGLRHHL